MIYTVTLNPGLDYNGYTSSMEYGKTNRMHDEYFSPGGKGLNVSAMLARYGEETKALGYIAGFTGQALKELLSKCDVDCDFIDVGEGFTRINVKVINEKVTEYNGEGIRLSEDLIRDLEEKLKALNEEDMVVFSGSIPRGADSGLYARLMAETKAGVILDASGDALKKGISLKPWLIKPNDEELSQVAEGPLNTLAEMIEAAKGLQKKGARNILCSLGPDGAFFVSEKGEVYTAKTPEVPAGHKLNTVAAGDTLLSSFVHMQKKTGDAEKALKFGVAAGTAAAYSPWLPELSFVEELYKSM